MPAWAGSRLAIIAIAIVAVALMGGDGFGAANAERFDRRQLTHPLGETGDALVAPLARWDAAWYLDIAASGYPAGDDARTAFFPLYPLLVRGLGELAGGSPAASLLAAYLVSLAALLGALVARAALAPIGRFTRRTEAIAARPDLSERIEVEGRDELARLAASFNATLDALQGAVDSQRRLVADASHELRTPIASLRANFETLRESERLPPAEREALRADIVEELDELTALVADVVELARGARPEESLDDVRLDTLVDQLVERARRRGDRRLVYATSLQPTLIRAAPDRIARAVSNLLDNARKWSPPGGEVEVELQGGTLTMRDQGPGFAEQDLPRVFERFYRSDEARGTQGSGLGLAIVKQAAETHGGAVEAANAPGGGALVRVSFGPPLDPAEAPPPRTLWHRAEDQLPGPGSAPSPTCLEPVRRAPTIPLRHRCSQSRC